MISTAKRKYLGVSAQKTRGVVDQVRGKKVGDALNILHFSPKLVARELEKLLKSAIANAQQADPNIDVDELKISRALVNEAPPLRRSRHVAMGRIFPILKRACHITFDLDIVGAQKKQKGGRKVSGG